MNPKPFSQMIEAFNIDHLQLEDGYLDKAPYKAIHFHGARLADSLIKVSNFLLQLERQIKKQPYPLCTSVRFSAEDEGSNLAWQVTVVLCDLGPDEG